MKTTMLALLGAAAFSLVAAPASAEVSIDSEGFGFVGKGDVQDAFGWNDHDLQANADHLMFRWAAVETASWICRKVHKNNVTDVARSLAAGVMGDLAYSARQNKQGHVTGFWMEGFVGEATAFASQGDYALWSCPGDPGQAKSGFVIVEGSQSSTSNDAGLEVSADGGATWVAVQSDE